MNTIPQMILFGLAGAIVLGIAAGVGRAVRRGQRASGPDSMFAAIFGAGAGFLLFPVMLSFLSVVLEVAGRRFGIG